MKAGEENSIGDFDFTLKVPVEIEEQPSQELWRMFDD